MLASAFTPLGPTVLIGASALQVPIDGTGGGGPTTFRIRCLVAAYLTWGQGSGISAAGAPTAGSPVVKTMGFAAGQVETFTLPPNSFFIASIAAAFEITPGEGV